MKRYEEKLLNKLLLDKYLKIKIKGKEFVFSLKNFYVNCSQPNKEEKYYFVKSTILRKGTVSEIAMIIKEYIDKKL